jgi:hypothetical protein
MTSWRCFPYFVACALLAFTGCSGGASSVPALHSAGPQSDHVVALSSRETLDAPRTVVKVQSCISGQSGVATFSAKGNAKGRFPGKFTASGTWSFNVISGHTLWTFGETFKITGGHAADGTITGSGTSGIAKCKTFGPGQKGLQYHLDTLSGAATTNLLKNGGKFLEEMH